ncbi:MAG: sensor histidine kinase [Gemmatimonadales bacterium]
MPNGEAEGERRSPRQHEVLRQASVALQQRPITLFQVTSGPRLIPLLVSAAPEAVPAAPPDLDAAFNRWRAPLVEGSRWLGCRLGENGGGRWCVAPVRKRPANPPPQGIERRSRERMILELAGLCIGLDEPPLADNRQPEPEALVELARQPGVIAHEVANPLTAALGWLDACFETLREKGFPDPILRDRLLDDLTQASEAVDQAIGFVRSIQDRVRGVTARRERFQVAPVIRSCVTLERPLARRTGVALEFVPPTQAEPIFLLGDPNALYRILTNLLRNATHASGANPAPVVVELHRTPDSLRITVRDHGIGIAPEHLPRVFEPGFTTKPPGVGSGMGLTIVRDLVKEMFNGRVDLASTLGQGTVVTLFFPIPPQRG